jgi:hypothetical protein
LEIKTAPDASKTVSVATIGIIEIFSNTAEAISHWTIGKSNARGSDISNFSNEKRHGIVVNHATNGDLTQIISRHAHGKIIVLSPEFFPQKSWQERERVETLIVKKAGADNTHTEKRHGFLGVQVSEINWSLSIHDIVGNGPFSIHFV